MRFFYAILFKCRKIKEISAKFCRIRTRTQSPTISPLLQIKMIHNKISTKSKISTNISKACFEKITTVIYTLFVSEKCVLG